MEIKVYINRALYKYLTLFTIFSIIVAWIVFSLSVKYDTWTDFLYSILFISILIVIVLLVYFIVLCFDKIYFVFNKNGITKFNNNKQKLFIRWEQISHIKQFTNSPILWTETRWSPSYLIVEYIDEKQIEKRLICPFPLKDALILSKSGLNTKLNELISIN